MINTGNIFTDLGFADAEERMATTSLALQINVIIKRKKLTQKQAAELLGIDQPKISALSTGKLSGFSLERLFRFLTILGQDIIINVTPKARSNKIAHVIVAAPKTIKKPFI
jgi:predicted XRE-type DNA-binding protein